MGSVSPANVTIRGLGVNHPEPTPSAPGDAGGEGLAGSVLGGIFSSGSELGSAAAAVPCQQPASFTFQG